MSDDRYANALDNEGRDLIEAALTERLPAVDHREEDIRRALELLDRRRSLLLVGSQGVGKTAVVHGIAQALAPREQGGMVEISTTTVLSGTRYLGEWQSKATAIATRAADTGTVLYISDLWNLPTAGRSSDNASNLLDAWRPQLESGKLVLLGEVTPEMLRRMSRQPGFASLFRQLAISPLGVQQAASAVQRAAERSDLDLGRQAQGRLMDLTSRFLPARPQPGPALELLHQVQDYRTQQADQGEEQLLSPAYIERVFTLYSGLPDFVVSRQATRSAGDIRRWFQERIVGQHEAIEAVIEAIALFKAGLHDPKKPLGTFFFVGPTGVGKTELARTLAEFLFGSPHRLLRFDLSEFKDFHSFEILLGSPRQPDRPATLVDPVRAQPFQVLLFDELEKAHPNVWDVLLPLLDEGRLTPPGAQAVDFRNTIVICTSNQGAQQSDRSLGFGAKAGLAEQRKNILRALERHFRPEFLNRFQHLVVFHPLSLEQVRTVARQELKRILSREGITNRNLVVDVEDAALDQVIERGYDPRYGARALKREIQRQLVLPLAMTLMEKPVEEGQILKLVARDGRVRVRALDTADSRQSRRDREPVRTEAGEKRARPQLRAALKTARQRLEVVAAAINEGFLRDGRERLLTMRKRPDFWQDTRSAARALRDLDRVTVVLDRLESLRGRGEELEQQLQDADGRQRLVRAAERLSRFEGAVASAHRQLVVMGWDGAWDALVELRPIGVGGRPARDLLVQIYSRWADGKHRALEWLRDPKDDDEPAMFAIKGPYAYGLLQREAGLHRLRGDDSTAVARVRVAPWTDERGEVSFQEHRALKGDGGYTERVRSLLVCQGGLVLRNARTLSDNRDLAAELAPSWARVAAPSDEVVRRYSLEPSMVRDPATGFSSGKPDALAPANLQKLLLLRVDAARESRSEEAPTP